MITFMDDLNMPAKDTFGSQPPLELMRQWIDYGFWYDRQKQTMKYVKVRQLHDENHVLFDSNHLIQNNCQGGRFFNFDLA